ncbi:hypothetical protein J5N97_023051 [Dioscorea zingiberensis]|uniref:DUF3741 domain-containing protein n=1 Tax=Dioscorea zingiberensis TaxID=325984 RepID=A0A9D5HB77_9LILI|nr:hypothetical protein J5N97_023051 [Dioscorea zingiberensis]
MAKRSRKRSARSKKDNAGCMWGFISLFDFRHSNAPRKLLSDRKRGSGRQHVVTGFSGNKFEMLSDVEEKQDFDENGTSEDRRDNRAMASVKSLMEEEMSKLQAGKKTDEEFEQPRSKLGYHREKNWKKISKNSKVATDLLLNDLRDLANLDSHQSHQSNSYEGSRSNFDLAAFMADSDGDNHQFAEKHKALNDVAETFLSRKLVEEKQVTGRESVYQSKQFINALETLNANKELFLKFVQDPNSVLLKYIQDLQSAHAGMLSDFDLCKCVEGNDRLRDDVGSSAQSERLISNKMFEKQNGHSFFRKKEKPKETMLSKESNSSQPLNRITVLKPSPSRTQNASMTITPTSLPSDSRKHQEVSERVGSYFSLKEIKRRLKNAIGDNKERRSISMDGVLHKIPYGQKSIEKTVPRKSFSKAQHTTPQPSFIVVKRDKIKVLKYNQMPNQHSLKPIINREIQRL